MNGARIPRGVTLIEMLLVLFVATSVLGVLAVTYGTADSDRKVAQTTQQLTTIRSTITSAWRSLDNYSTVSAANAQPMLPPELRTLQVPFGGTYAIAAATWGAEANAAFDITTPRTSPEHCTRLALAAASQFDSVVIGTTSVTTANGQQPNPNTTRVACDAANNATIWRSL